LCSFKFHSIFVITLVFRAVKTFWRLTTRAVVVVFKFWASFVCLHFYLYRAVELQLYLLYRAVELNEFFLTCLKNYLGLTELINQSINIF
jgi:hypothetical protein